jgi:hypothetical protein
MYAEIVSAIESAKALRELLKAANSLSNYNEIVAAVSEVSAKLMDATGVALASQEKQSLLAQRVRDLEEELVKLKDWEAQAKNYSLIEVASGVFTYLYKPTMQSDQPRHWACAKCFQERKLFVLQRQHPPSYLCQNYGSKISPFKDGSLVPIDAAY